MPFSTLFVLYKQLYLCCLLKYEMKVKRSKQSKAPSINKHCFLFPLSFFCHSRAVFTRVPFLDRKGKGVKGLGSFCDLWGLLCYGFTKNTHDIFIPPMFTIWHQIVPTLNIIMIFPFLCYLESATWVWWKRLVETLRSFGSLENL